GRPGQCAFVRMEAGSMRLARVGSLRACSTGDNPRMAQGKRISADIGGDALQAIRELGAAARLARTAAGGGQAAAARRLGVHVQTIGRIESGEPGVAIGHVLGLLALYGVTVKPQATEPRPAAS